MLTKPTGTRRVVEKVADLPSGLNAAAGEEYIVRENEAVYGLDDKRQWVQTGSYAKHSAVKAEHITAHLNAKGNPHKTTLSDILAEGSEVELQRDLVLKGRGVRVQPKPGTPGVAIGETGKKAEAAIALGSGRKGSKTPLVGIYELENGEPIFLLDGDGNLNSQGEVSFAGGWRGDLAVSGAIKAKGLEAETELGLAGEKVAFATGKKGARKLLLALDDQASVLGNLSVAGDLELRGSLKNDVIPASPDKLLGGATKRWRNVFARGVNIEALDGVDEPLIAVKSKAKRKAHLIELGLDTPGDLFALTANGLLGLGTAAPRRHLDVRGGAAFGDDGSFEIIDVTEAGVELGFNFNEKEAPADPATVAWRIIPGNKTRDYFEVLRHGVGKDQNWSSLLRLEKNFAEIGTNLTVKGDARAETAIIEAITDPEEKNIFRFAPEGVSYSSIKHKFDSRLLKGSKDAGFELDVVDEGSDDAADLLRVLLGGSAKFRVLKDGSLVAVGANIGGITSRWNNAYLAGELQVGKRTVIADGVLGTNDGDLELLPKTGVIGLSGSLKFRGPASEIYADPTTERLVIIGEEEITFDVSGDHAAIIFSGKGGTLENVRKISGKTSAAAILDFEQTRTKDKTSTGLVLDVEGRGAIDSSYMKVTQDGKLVLNLTEDELRVGGALNVGGLVFDKVEGVVDLAGERSLETLVPDGAFILAVLATPITSIDGCAYFTLGVDGHHELFAGASTKLAAGQTTRGLNQHRTNPIATGDPITVFADPAATGKFKVVAHYLNPGA